MHLGAKRRLRRSYTYMVTITKHQKLDHVTKEEIDDIIRTLKWVHTGCDISDIVYETSGKYNQLHCHLLLYSRFALLFQNFSKCKGFRIYWKSVSIGEITKIINYMYKDQQDLEYSQSQILDTNRFKLYAF